MPADQRCAAYRRFLETLSPAALDRLDEVAAPNIHFRDPFNDARGLPRVRQVFAALFRDVDEPRFRIVHSACSGKVCFLRWHFTCRPRTLARGHPWLIDGVTELHFDDGGRVVEHLDYWDSGHYVYERVPLFGLLIRFIRKRLAATTG